MRKRLPWLRQKADRVENAAKIHQRCQHKSRNDGDVVEVSSINGIDESSQRKKYRSEEHHQHRYQKIVQLQIRQQHRHRGNHETDRKPTRNTTSYIAEKYDRVGRRRNQHLLDVTLITGAEERRHDIRVRVGNHRHHDDTGRDVIHIRKSAHLADPGADEIAEDNQVQRHRNGWRQNGLLPDTQEAPDLFAENGLEGD